MLSFFYFVLFQFNAFADGHNQYFGAAVCFYFGFVSVNILCNQRPGVVVYGDNVFCFQELSGNRCVSRAHGKVIADRQHGVIKRVKALQKLHIAKQGGVTGKIQFGAVKIYNKAAGMAARNAAAVEGGHNAYMAEVKLMRAAKMHAVRSIFNKQFNSG